MLLDMSVKEMHQASVEVVVEDGVEVDTIVMKVEGQEVKEVHIVVDIEVEDLANKKEISTRVDLMETHSCAVPVDPIGT